MARAGRASSSLRALVAGLGAGLLTCAALAAPAAADDVVVHGPAFPDQRAFLTYVSCDGFFAPGAVEPVLRINRGPDRAPRGLRSFGVAPAGAGTAIGPTYSTPLLSGTSLSFWVRAPAGTRGVAYVWYAAPDAPAGHAWRGTGALHAAGGWSRFEVAGQPLDWELVDLRTVTTTERAGRAALGDFVAAHGDGPGLVVAGFGCDGAPFHLDALTVASPGGSMTYDFEGLVLGTTIEKVAPQRPGAAAVLRGVTRGRDGKPVGEPLVLEATPVGQDSWRPVGDPVLADEAGVVKAEVSPEVDTAYRWRMPEVEYAAGHVSEPVVVAGR